jgi:hypothetical protein
VTKTAQLERSPKDPEERSRSWWHVIVLIAIGLIGALWVIPKFGGPHFGDAEQCEGIGFGCSPNQFGDTVSVALVLVFGLVVTGVIGRFAYKKVEYARYAWHITAVGIAISLLMTALSWNGGVVRYGVPALSVEEGRTEARRILSAMREAVGGAEPFSTAALADVRVESMPAPAAIVAAIEEKPASPCRDVNGRDTGTSHFSWAARADVLVPAVTVGDYQASDMHPPNEYVAQVERVARAFESLGYPPHERVVGPTRWAVSARKKGPEPLTDEYLPNADYSLNLDFGFIPSPKPDEYRLRMSAHVTTPCLRR